MPGYQRVKGSNVWLKYHAGWVRPEVSWTGVVR